MKICAISDTHGLHRHISIDPCDILCIAGDISPLNIQGQKSLILTWLKEDFIPWCEDLPANKIFLTPGNHDLVFYKRDKEIKKLFKNTKIVYLVDELGVYIDKDKEYKIWGSPWCTIFGNWAFMKSPEFELEQFQKMPDDIDILIVHDPPYGACDICLDHPRGNYNRLGNPELTQVIKDKCPKLCVCGHLHSGNHMIERINNTDVYNVSIVNEQYLIHYKPLYLLIK